MRTIDVIDAELRVLTAYRRASGCSVRVIDRLLDERLAATRNPAARHGARLDRRDDR
ncbi:hypothetical protein SEA_RAYMOND7_29 [Mycobacterium phage Raymond7]|uniref:Uncharacterized protein n=1 Tax=Mycobacterium phage Raymond7 TaxID=2743931 RepID=A0AA48V636_9CAUD|nr:hypothetical protein [Mycolicibacterium goodii]YP_010051830.1 hypothetical protein KD927_gp29 [Mycobacterium phage Raymond7]MBU8815941.1 hypothetical protein [Mycolicibacterium goodii]QKY79208.1 hypothetical protein SEA_RAYMOND7_29 [Mycobacterium phage Raymond7]